MFLFSSSRESGKRLARSCEKRDSCLAQVGQVKIWKVRRLILRNGIGQSLKTMGSVTQIDKVTTSIILPPSS
jgi:hypothetical protein